MWFLFFNLPFIIYAVLEFVISINDWKCCKCGGYFLVNFYEIKEGDKVYFIFSQLQSDKVTNSIYRVGLVVEKTSNILVVKYNKKKYRVENTKVYPFEAPVAFIYNMFWICGCK
ncbi:hypothetical protein [Acinetobacter pittii]|uniref:hypothetical protein n=1 Tax=Acinetobacter pittii TaxID=48296 RepID=UPI00195266C9|nr:hypothetical protein [Acinetobacter pittii]QRQ11549.1 hypothetical protein I6J46_10055 [Acinetobacter pittii]